MHVLRTDLDVGALAFFNGNSDISERDTGHDRAVRILDRGDELVIERGSFGSGLVHLPVSCHNGSAKVLIHIHTPYGSYRHK